MKRTYLSWACSALAGLCLLSSCTKEYNDSELRGRLDKVEGRTSSVEGRLTSVENQIKEMNSNISALRTLVTALEKNVFVRSVTPEGTDGYRINFSDGQSVQIKHGKQGERGERGLQGEAGKTPIIGVRQEQGRYYWTVDGQWLLIGGNKVPTTGEQGIQGERGLQGISPKLRIQNDRWEISYDDGANWSDLGRAKGDKGERGEYVDNGLLAIFERVTEDAQAVHIRLSSGATIVLPKEGGMSITFAEPTTMGVLPNSQYELHYTLAGRITANTKVYAVGQGEYTITVKPTDERNGTLLIETPKKIRRETTILVFVNNDLGQTIMASLKLDIPGRATIDGAAEGPVVGRGKDFYQSGLIVHGSYTAPSKGRELSLYTYTVERHSGARVIVTKEGQSWLHPSSERVADNFTITVDANTTGVARKAVIVLDDGTYTEYILINQVSADEYHIAQAGTLEQLVSPLDKELIESIKLTGYLNKADYDFLRSCTRLRTIDLSELSDTTLPAEAFANRETIDTILLPKGLTAIPDRLFVGSSIRKLTIPERVRSIGVSAFEDCSNLQGDLIIPSGVESIGNRAFANSHFDGKLVLGEGLQNIGEEAFFNCYRFRGNLIIPDKVQTIHAQAFAYAGTYTRIVLGASVRTVGRGAFASTGFDELHCKPSTPPNLEGGLRGVGLYGNTLVVPIGLTDTYRDAFSWRETIKEVQF